MFFIIAICFLILIISHLAGWAVAGLAMLAIFTAIVWTWMTAEDEHRKALAQKIVQW